MNENINLCEILKDCPKGTKFFSYIHGQVEFSGIDLSVSHPIIVTAETKRCTLLDKTFSKEGYYDNDYNGICTLVPSLEQPDWSKWKCPKPKFDPKTLKPFDKVLARIGGGDAYCWFADFVSVPALEGDTIVCVIGDRDVSMVIPYNEETKHLVGTSDEAPEYYKYWEN